MSTKGMDFLPLLVTTSCALFVSRRPPSMLKIRSFPKESDTPCLQRWAGCREILVAVRRDVGGGHFDGAAFYIFVLLFSYLETAIFNCSSPLLCNWS